MERFNLLHQGFVLVLDVEDCQPLWVNHDAPGILVVLDNDPCGSGLGSGQFDLDCLCIGNADKYGLNLFG